MKTKVLRKKKTPRVRGRQLDQTQWKEVYNSLNNEQKAIFDKMREQYQSVSGHGLKQEYLLGKMALEASDKAVYGDGFVGVTARLMGIKPGLLYKRIQLCNTFDDEVFQEILSWKNATTGQGLSISHLELVLGVPEADRLRLLKETVDKNWNIDTLKTHARSYKTTSPARANCGRKVVIKKTVPEKLAQIQETVGQLRKYAATWHDPEHGLLHALRALPPEALDPHWIDGMQRAGTACEQLRDELESVLRHTRDALHFLQSCFRTAGPAPTPIPAPETHAPRRKRLPNDMFAAIYEE